MKINTVIEKRLLPLANRVTTNRYLIAIQNAFLTILPLMAIGSFALILGSPPMDYTQMSAGIWRDLMQGWQSFADFAGASLFTIFHATTSCLSLYVALGIGYFLGKQYKLAGFLPTITAGVTFFILNASGMEMEMVFSYFGGEGLFAAMIVSILTIEAYRFLTVHGVGKISIPGNGVPPALSQSFAALVPISLIAIVAMLAASASLAFAGVPFPQLMTVIMSPLVGVVDNVFGVIFLSLLTMLLWWFGIHDTAISGITKPFLVSNNTINATAFAAGTAAVALPHILTYPFWWTFMAIGGSGATFGLAILLLRAKSKHLRTVGKLSVIPAFFNINEPLIFGLPLMLNPVFLFPFLFAQTLNGVIAYLLMDMELIARTFADPSWNMFCPIGALISTMDVKAVILVIGLIILDVLIYYPFFKIYDKQKFIEETEEQEVQKG